MVPEGEKGVKKHGQAASQHGKGPCVYREADKKKLNEPGPTK